MKSVHDKISLLKNITMGRPLFIVSYDLFMRMLRREEHDRGRGFPTVAADQFREQVERPTT